MKKIFLLFLLILPLTAYSQESHTIKELGLIFGEGNSPGITFRVGKPNSLFRFSSLLINGEKTTLSTASNDIDQKYYGLGLMVGKEFRIQLTDNLWARQGIDLTFRYQYEEVYYPNGSYNQTVYGSYYSNSGDLTEETNTYIPGFDLVFGLNYELTDNLIVGIELLPYFQMIKSKESITQGDNPTEDIKTRQFKYGIDSNSALLSIVLRLN
ncbi:hypothetical protein [Carboxylicivirga linearis]|uniref:Outer membrane protein beta-barrel domain-containing protein n=1 Tax=Carboxylicivirga linearis TaxID=1628157 RepID=A0ABS5JX20_9BACT|nr:hypothetical protein [Carboxylicivirga linearis]MBS2099456.1 hypothetical protein [Carboxylicivirga linearis]